MFCTEITSGWRKLVALYSSVNECLDLLLRVFFWYHLISSCRTVNLDASKIISRNFRSLRDDSMTRNILNKLPLKTYRRTKNLRDLLVRSSLLRNLPNQPTGAFPCNRTVCLSCRHVNSSTTRDILASRTCFRCITDSVIYYLTYIKCPSTSQH